MKKSLYIFLFALLPAACTPDEPAVSSVSFAADAFDFSRGTRSDIAADGTFIWSQSDTVGIFPDKGSQIYFAIEEGAGASCAVFDGGAWGLKPETAYLSYYPFDGDIYLKPNDIGVSFSGQRQSANGSTAGTGAYDYMYSSGTVSADGTLLFRYHHLNSLLRLELNVPAGTYSNVKLSSNSLLFVLSGRYDLSSSTPSIKAVGKSASMDVALDNVRLTDAGTLVVYVMIAPADFSGKQFDVKVTGPSVTAQTFSFNIQEPFKAGHGYVIK